MTPRPMPFTWLERGRVAASIYLRDERALTEAAEQGVRLVINLHERAHDSDALARHGLRQIHIPVPDFTAPAPGQLDEGVAAIDASLAQGEPVLVHCATGCVPSVPARSRRPSKSRPSPTSPGGTPKPDDTRIDTGAIR
jgi:hypothetical protein